MILDSNKSLNSSANNHTDINLNDYFYIFIHYVGYTYITSNNSCSDSTL
jgi:hypothetical protein